MRVERFEIPGADDQPILGNQHVPAGAAQGIVIIAHGFKGYKDYGMFPAIAHQLARSGFIAVRFNFSHSGMTEKIETFERPDLFEKDTWNRQVFDLERVIAHATAGSRLPYVLFGHSRGGAAVLLVAGRAAAAKTVQRPPAGIITAAAPATTCALPQEVIDELESQGSIVSPSSRTGQDLRIGLAWLAEQREQPEAHDLLKMAAAIACPILAIHGGADPTVPAEDARRIGNAARDGRTIFIERADHVFNTPNPFPSDAKPGAELQSLLDSAIEFANEVCE